ncbi:MAG: bifunctional folylpolyglutamate synthase/dihydrofolate synthase [Saccharofermentans sp.]|nr:bifunctional folylpolyglutamate synthase/dihydrofolate synthase [Saccharofermentans sp.]
MSSDNTPEFLKDALKFGINLGLDRMNALDELLGNPQKDLKVIHLAGTNGKGSTATFISSIMAASGKKVGIYTSPFLERFAERIRIINGRSELVELAKNEALGEIPADDLARLSTKVEEAAKKMDEMGLEHPTEFELVTAICYLWFKEQKVDVAVLETGLGGRLDSTNVIENPLCTVITAMGLDHTDRLGETIDLIAAEKAGIFKPGCPAVVCDPDEMILDQESRDIVREVFVKRAEELNVPLEFSHVGDVTPIYTLDARMRFELDGETYSTSLLGLHQTRNAAAAIACARKIDGVTQEDIAFGIEHAIWKGRAECLSIAPVVIMDGGHNDQGAQSLAAVLKQVLGGALDGVQWRAVMGVMKDKDVSGMINQLKAGGVNLSDVRTVRASNSRSMNPEELSDIVKNVYNNSVMVSSYDDARQAVREAYTDSLMDGMALLVTGSLYLVGEVRGVLKELISDEE